MKILEIYAEDFGCLSDRRFTFGEGFNLIEGANESGKSTLQALLRFLFYGFPRRAGAEGEERDKRLSWKWRRAAGSAVVAVNDSTYTVTRKYLLRGTAGKETPVEELHVIDMTTGREVERGDKTPGEFLLGLPAELYDSTLCVRQSDIDRVGTPDTGEAVTTLLFSGGSGFDSEMAEKKLMAARRELMLYKGNGGRVPELETRLAELDEELATAKTNTEQLLHLRADVARFRAQVADRRRQLNAVNASLTVADLDKKILQYDEWHKAVAEEESCRAKLEQLRSEQAATAAPDSGFFDRVRGLLWKHTRAEDHALQTKAEVDLLRSVSFDKELIEGHAKAEELGGLAGIEKKLSDAARRRSGNYILAIMALVIAIVLVAGAFLASAAFLPLLLIGAVAGLAAAFLFYRAVKCSFLEQIVRNQLGIEEGTSIRAHLERCAKEDDAYLAHQEKLLLAEAQLARAKTECMELMGAVNGELSGVGATEKCTTVQMAQAALSGISRRAEQSREALTAATVNYEKARGITAALGAQIDPEAEQALRATRKRTEGSAEETPEALIRKRDYLSEAVAGLDNKRAEAERAEAALAAVAKDPAPLETERVAVEAELAEARQRLAALDMALEALKAANESLREGVLPRIAGMASEIFATLTEGKYSALRINDRFAVTLDTENGPLPLSRFSAGCRDAAYMALRLALVRTVSTEEMPLLLDEALSRLDDTRAKALMKVLQNYCKGGAQCLLFTCHSREAAFLSRHKNIQRITL
ncbi:MAG: hypothetical protein E7644_06875 [Ruminococcaceae bacterium]|nr:hypothetical protein [Oscillospiraceae bacterium]